MTVAIAVAALVLSLSTFVTNRWRDRRDLLLRVHERLVTTDQQRGRLLLHRMRDEGTRVEDLSEDDYVLINNALAALNVLGIYYKRRYIRRRDVLDFWAVPLVRLLPAAEPFLAHRDSFSEQGQTWPELHALAGDARKYLRRTGREAEATRALPSDPSVEVI